MMRHLSIFIIVTVSIYACGNRRQAPEIEETESLPASTVFDSIFFSQPIQDSLSMFMESIDTVEDMFVAKTMYRICLERYDNRKKSRIDTILHLDAYCSFHPPFLADYQAKGAVDDGSKVLMMGYAGFETLPSIVNEDVLSMDTFRWYASDEYREMNGYFDGQEAFRNSRKYKLHNRDSLILLSMYQSFHVNPACGWGTNTYDVTEEIIGGFDYPWTNQEIFDLVMRKRL